MGQWHHRFVEYADSPSTQEREGCVFESLYPETCFQNSWFSGAAFSGSIWTVSQNDAVHVRFRKRALSSGQQAVFVPAPLNANELRLSTPALPATRPSQGEDVAACANVMVDVYIYMYHYSS